MALYLVFMMMSSFFLGGNIRKWLLDHELDLWEKVGMVLHPAIIVINGIVVLHSTSK